MTYCAACGKLYEQQTDTRTRTFCPDCWRIYQNAQTIVSGLPCPRCAALQAEVARLTALVETAALLLHHTEFWTEDGITHPHPDCPACQWCKQREGLAPKEDK
jgi:hypothetical protein